jgi:hypothetical protein
MTEACVLSFAPDIHRVQIGYDAHDTGLSDAHGVSDS